MRIKILSTLFFLVVSAILAIGFAPFAFAGTVGPISIPNPITSVTFTDLLDRVLGTILVFASPVLLIMIVYAALLFMVSGGNTTRLTSARGVLKWALIGFVVIVLAKLMVLILQYAIAGI